MRQASRKLVTAEIAESAEENKTLHPVFPESSRCAKP